MAPWPPPPQGSCVSVGHQDRPGLTFFFAAWSFPRFFPEGESGGFSVPARLRGFSSAIRTAARRCGDQEDLLTGGGALRGGGEFCFGRAKCKHTTLLQDRMRCLGFVGAVVLALCAGVVQSQTKPNFVILFVDGE